MKLIKTHIALVGVVALLAVFLVMSSAPQKSGVTGAVVAGGEKANL